MGKGKFVQRGGGRDVPLLMVKKRGLPTTGCKGCLPPVSWIFRVAGLNESDTNNAQARASGGVVRMLGAGSPRATPVSSPRIMVNELVIGPTKAISRAGTADCPVSGARDGGGGYCFLRETRNTAEIQKGLSPGGSGTHGCSQDASPRATSPPNGRISCTGRTAAAARGQRCLS